MYGQWPINQYLGSDSTLVSLGKTPAGGIKGNFIPVSYSDTTAANLTRVKNYAGAIIYTVGGNKLWVRNSTATGWIEQGSSSSVNIYNSDGTINNTRVLDLSTYALAFSRSSIKQFAAEDNLTTIGSPNNIRRFTVYNDSITLTGSDQSASSSDSVLVRTASGRIKTRAQSAFGSSYTFINGLTESGGTVKWGGTLIENTDVDLNDHDLAFVSSGNNGTFSVSLQGMNTIGFTVNNSGDASSSIAVSHDTTFFYPHKGLIVIDTAYRATNLTNKLVAIWDSTSRIFQFIDVDSLGTTPTLQQVFDVQSNVAVFTTDNEIDANGNDFDIHSASSISLQVTTGVQKYIGLLNSSVMTMYVGDETAGQKVSALDFYQDSIHIRPNQGILNIDSIRSWSGIADTTYKKVMTWDTRNGRWEYSNWYGGSGSSSDSSFLFFDTTYNRLGVVVSEDTSIVKSLRIQVNGSTVTPTSTDSTLNWDLTGLTTSLTNGLTLSSGVGKLGGTLTDATTTIDGDGNSLQIVNLTDSQIQGDGELLLQHKIIQVTSNAVAVSEGIELLANYTNRGSSISVSGDTIKIKPGFGRLLIDTLAGGVGTKALRYDPTTGMVTYADTTTGGSGTDNANVGSGYRWVKPSTQEIKTFFDGLYLDIDSSSNTDGLTVKVDTASMFPAIRSTIPASSGPSGSGTNLQVALWSGTNTLIGHQRYTYTNSNDYPSLIIGAGSGATYGASLQLRDVAGTYSSITSDGGAMSFYGSSTYRSLNFYDYSGGAGILARFYSGTGVKYNDLYGIVTASTLSVLSNEQGAITVQRTVPYAATGNNYHGYTDQTDFRLGQASFNSFGSFVKIGNDRTNMGHYAAFQAVWSKDSSNSVTDIYDFVSAVSTMAEGTIDSVFRFKVFEMTKSGGTVGVQYGIHIPALTEASTNYGAYIENNVGIGTASPTMKLQVASGRFGKAKGANVAAANDLTLGADGNMFHITGTTQINAITTANWQAGSEITLIFDSTPTVKNNTAGGGGTAVILLAGGADFSATANDVLKLAYDGTSWYEVARSVN